MAPPIQLTVFIALALLVPASIAQAAIYDLSPVNLAGDQEGEASQTLSILDDRIVNVATEVTVEFNGSQATTQAMAVATAAAGRLSVSAAAGGTVDLQPNLVTSLSSEVDLGRLRPTLELVATSDRNSTALTTGFAVEAALPWFDLSAELEADGTSFEISISLGRALY